MILSTDPLLIKVHKIHNDKHPELNTYQVMANGRAIGYVTRWESYKWEIESQFAPMMASDCKNRKTAVKRIEEYYREYLRSK